MSAATNPSGGADTAEQLRKALRAIKELRARAEAAETATHAPIAIVGLAVRFPGGADTPEKLWALLRDGVDAIGEVPPDRWDNDRYFDADPAAPGKMYVRHGGFVADVDRFDAGFFGVSPREAEHMDPQHRLLLETSWEALERAGIAADRLAGSSTGVFVGISNQDYTQLLTARGLETIDPYVGSGNAHSVAAGRLSYTLGLHGPALAVDTACSSSLVAVHLAVQSLRAGECSLALASGVNLLLSPLISVNHSRARMLAPDGRCKAFDAAADGFIRSDGCGVVVLKRLAEAQRDGDRVLAVIRGSAVNQDGRTSGITVPSGPSQQAVIRAALQQAGVTPAAIGYVEAHGTGTAIGDPIELGALGAVFAADRPPDAPLRVGSIKTNLGHLESAAGIAGLIKVVLALQCGEIPPHLHFKQPSPLVPWHELPVEIPTRVVAWSGTAERIAGVSSFGFGGTNAHLIVSEAPRAEDAAPAATEGDATLTLSARSDVALRELAERYRGFLATTNEAWADICAAAAHGRAKFKHGLSLAARDVAGGRALLETFLRGESDAAIAVGDGTRWAPRGEAGRYRRVDLPTYPFQRRRYWFETKPAEETVLPAPAYVVAWESKARSTGDAAAVNGAWCVIGDDRGVTAELRRRGLRLVEKGAQADARILFFAAGTAADLPRLQEIVRTLRVPTRLTVVTRNAVAAAAGERPNPDAALAWSAAQVIALEYPELNVRRIDVGAETGSGPLTDEFFGGAGDDDVLLRGAERRVARLQAQELPAAVFRAQADGVYLITGGLGALGLRVAEWLVDRGAQHLALFGRRAPTAEAQETLTRLRARGAAVTTLAVDVAERAALTEAVARCTRERPLRGVFHAAGVAGYAPLATLSAHDWSTVLRAKVEGARVLDELMAGMPLDAFVLFSSIASVWGSKGQAHYAAANGFLDALAARRRAEGRPALSVSWGPWAGGGMATPEASALLAASGVRALNPGAALAALERALTGGTPHVAVAAVDWAAFRQVYELRGARSLLARLPGAAPAVAPAIATEGSPLAATLRGQVAAMRAHVQGVVAQVLKLPPGELPDPQQGFADLGIDSLMAVELKNRLTADLGVPLPATLIFDYPDVERLARYLSAKLEPAKNEPSAAVATHAAAVLTPAVGAKVAELSEAEVEALLLKKLEAL